MLLLHLDDRHGQPADRAPVDFEVEPVHAVGREAHVVELDDHVHVLAGDGMDGDLGRVGHGLLPVRPEQANFHGVRTDLKSEDRHDEHPGMLGGILSLILSDTNPKKEFQIEQERAVKYFNRAEAYRIFTAYKQEYPTAPELAQMYLDIVRLYTATKETQIAAETLAEFEKLSHELLAKIDDRAARLKVERETERRAAELKREAQRAAQSLKRGSISQTSPSQGPEGGLPPQLRGVRVVRDGKVVSDGGAAKAGKSAAGATR